MLLVQSTLEYTQKNLTFYDHWEVRFVEFCLILFVFILGPILFGTHLCIPIEENLRIAFGCTSHSEQTLLSDKKSN